MGPRCSFSRFLERRPLVLGVRQVTHWAARTRLVKSPPGPDPNYPTYNSFPQGSIGEVGIDGQTVAIHDPRLKSDFMSYCGPVWVSPYTYMGLKHSIHESSFTPRVVEGGGSGASVWATEKAEFYHLALRVHRQEGGHRAEIRSAIRFTRRPPRGIESGCSKLTLEVYGENDTLIGVHRCEDVTSHILPDHPFIDYLVDFPASIHLKLIRLVRAGRVLLEREVERATDCQDRRGQAGRRSAR